MSKIIIAYMPVLHAGYLRFLKNHVGKVETLYIWGPEIIAQFDHLQRKDIRALEPNLIAKALQNWSLGFEIKILDLKTLAKINTPQTTIVTTNEMEMDQLIEKYLDQARIKKDSIWLRYDRKKSLEKDTLNPQVTVTHSQLSQKWMDQALTESEKSADWWRQVGAVIIKDDKILLTGYNSHVPHEQMPYINGDPRGNFNKGEFIELSTALHAEAGLIAEAARRGIELKNAEMYVTTFPCPPCAKLIAYSGIKKVYFQEGYAMLDGESILESQGVEIVKVEN